MGTAGTGTRSGCDWFGIRCTVSVSVSIEDDALLSDAVKVSPVSDVTEGFAALHEAMPRMMHAAASIAMTLIFKRFMFYPKMYR